MTVDDAASRVRSLAATRYPRCSPDQALVYAVEDEVDVSLGLRVVAEHDVGAVLVALCEAEDIDEPSLSRSRRSGSSDAAAVDLVTREISVRHGPLPLSVLVHELAHLVSAADNHGREFRDELVRLSRAHVSVAHAAMLRTLFSSVGLDVADWRA